MKYVTAKYPQSKASKAVQSFTLVLALFITLSSVTQLITIEKFLPLVEQYVLPGGYASSLLVVFGLLACGVFGLPFLLRMKLSPLFRLMSAVLLNMYSCVWLFLAFWQQYNHSPLLGTGIFGGILKDKNFTELLVPFAVLLVFCTVSVTWLLRRDFQYRKLN